MQKTGLFFYSCISKVVYVPFVSEKEKLSHIIGEVYEVDEETLRKLDILEDHPHWYERKKVKIILENGKEIESWLYFNEKTEGRIIIKSGDFADF